MKLCLLLCQPQEEYNDPLHISALDIYCCSLIERISHPNIVLLIFPYMFSSKEYLYPFHIAHLIYTTIETRIFLIPDLAISIFLTASFSSSLRPSMYSVYRLLILFAMT